MDVRVRLVQFDELRRLLGLYKYLNPEDPDIYGEISTNELWSDIFNDPGQKTFVIEEDGLLVAACTLVVVRNLTRGGKPYGLIENVVTHDHYRKRGYGKAVLNKAVETARLNGCYKVMLMTGRKDEGTLSFYKKSGFEQGAKTGFYMRL